MESQSTAQRDTGEPGADHPRSLVAKGYPIATALERYVLPFIYFFFAFQTMDDLWTMHVHGWAAAVAANTLKSVYFARLAILSVLQLFIGFMLLIAEDPVVPPRSMKDVVVPLVTSFFFLFYNVARWLPPSMQENLAPRGWQGILALVAILLTVPGYAISLWGVMHLGRSF